MSSTSSKECKCKIDYVMLFLAVLIALQVHSCSHKISDAIVASMREKSTSTQPEKGVVHDHPK